MFFDIFVHSPTSHTHRRRLQNTFIMLETCLVHLGKCFRKITYTHTIIRRNVFTLHFGSRVIFDQTYMPNTSFIASIPVYICYIQYRNRNILILMWKMYNFILAPLLFHFHTYVLEFRVPNAKENFLTFMTLIFFVLVQVITMWTRALSVIIIP